MSPLFHGFTPVIEIISKEGLRYIKEVQTDSDDSISDNKYGYWKSIYGFEFNKWIPIYINKNHFDSINSELISLICELLGYKKENFKPVDVLKLIPPILVKTAIHFLKGEVHQSYAAIDAYSQFQYLLVKLKEIYPEIQTEIDNQVELFMKSNANRHKREAGDLGEFMIKCSLHAPVV